VKKLEKVVKGEGEDVKKQFKAFIKVSPAQPVAHNKLLTKS
jgi:hypothetical protein